MKFSNVDSRMFFKKPSNAHFDEKIKIEKRHDRP